MADLTLPLSVEYETTVEAYEALTALVQPRLLGSTRRRVLLWSALVVALLFLCIVLAIKAGIWESIVIASVASLILLGSFWNAYDNARANVKNARRAAAGRAMRLDFTSEGTTEHDRGIKCFAPWSAMKNCCVFRNVLFVELANGHWAIIPTSTLKPAFATIEAIQQILLEHGVAERKLPTRK